MTMGSEGQAVSKGPVWHDVWHLNEVRPLQMTAMELPALPKLEATPTTLKRLRIPRPISSERRVLSKPKPLPQFEPAESWDQFYDKESSEVPLSEKPLEDQDSVFGSHYISQSDVETYAVAALQGHESQAIHWDGQAMVLQISDFRMFALSQSTTNALLQTFVDAGSWVRRLRYTVKRITELNPHRTAIALSAVITELLEVIGTHTPHSQPLLSLLNESRDMRSMAYALSRILGCEDLSHPAFLNRIRRPVKLLNIAYKEAMLLQFNPKLYVLLWHVVSRVMVPWVNQVNMMMGHKFEASFGPDVSQFLQVYLPDIFVARDHNRPGLFKVEPANLPMFISKEHSLALLECLNCCVLLFHANHEIPTTHQIEWCDNGTQERRPTEMVANDNPFSVKLVNRQLNLVPKQKMPEYATPPSNTNLAILSTLSPAFRQRQVLNGTLWEVLTDKSGIHHLASHITILIQILLLGSGTLHSEIIDKVATWDPFRRPSESQVMQLSLILDEILQDHYVSSEIASLVSFNLQQDENKLTGIVTDHVTVVYQVPMPVQALISERVLDKCLNIFSYILRLQYHAQRYAQNHKHHELVQVNTQLQAITLWVWQVQAKLDSVLEQQPTLMALIEVFENLDEQFPSEESYLF